MAVEDLLGWGGAIGDCPVVDGRLGDHADSRVGHPFPEHNVLVANMRLDLLLRLDVENLQRTLGWASASVGKYVNARERGLQRAAPGSSASRAQSGTHLSTRGSFGAGA